MDEAALRQVFLRSLRFYSTNNVLLSPAEQQRENNDVGNIQTATESKLISATSLYNNSK
jgi:hypothetical protein